MSLINISTFKSTDKTKPFFVDLKLDVKQNVSKKPMLNSKIVLRDIEASYDLDAIKNSIFNLFTTMPGEKILNPIYGLNLLQFVFTGITEENSRAMGELILRGINKFEPRITVNKIFVFPDIDEQSYQIGLKLDVPSLNLEGISLKGTLSESGFYII